MGIMELAELEKEDNRVGLVFKYKVVRNGLMIKETFERRPKGSKGESLVDIWGTSILGRLNKKPRCCGWSGVEGMETVVSGDKGDRGLWPSV